MLAFFGGDVAEDLLAFSALGRIAGVGIPCRRHTRRGRRQSNPRLARDQFQEFVRGLDEDARAVPGIGLASARAAVIQIQQGLQGLLNDAVGLAALDVGHESHTAGLMLELRVVQTLFGRRAGPPRLTSFSLAVCSNRHVQEMQISKLSIKPKTNLGSI